MKTFCSCSLILLMSSLFFALDAQKILNAYRINSDIKVDGFLQEEAWQQAEIASDFKTISPEYGKSPQQDTRVRVLYDDEAVYISAEMDEVSRDSIMTELTQRDDLGNTDFFEVLIDTYGNGTDGVQFVVGATGVQYDAKKGNNGSEDRSWDVVWFSEVNLGEKGWICEMKIPYSAIRFPDREEQEWIINFTRRQARNNVHGVWDEIDPLLNGIFTQSGFLRNIKGIKPPVRLQFSPYFSAYTVSQSNGNDGNISQQSFNGGMDLKYGINDAFTLDMTLIPDFGQVESDDNIVNLSPFEVQFAEKRPFFTEGLELFQKANIFYSRRIGGRPVNYYSVYNTLQQNEEVISNPQNGRLLNASKVSGRNSRGLGIAVFNAIESGSAATIRNNETGETRDYQTQGLTNYNIVVFDKNLKNNSYVSFINTNVWRQGAEFYDANVSGIEFDIKDKKQNYSVEGVAAVSVQSFTNRDNNVGHKMGLDFNKISGNFNYSFQYFEESPNYNPNDLGFLSAPNERSLGFFANYNIYEPLINFNRANFWFGSSYRRIVDPNAFNRLRFNIGAWFQTREFFNIEFWGSVSPQAYDYFEPRVPGRFMVIPGFCNAGMWIGTDNRKKFRTSFSSNIYQLDEEGRWGYSYNINPRFRVSNRFTVYLRTYVDNQFDDTGWVNFNDGNIIMGQRDRLIVENLGGFFYNFTEKIGLNMRVRHYWDRGIYRSFHHLSQEGLLLQTDYDAPHDYTGSFFNIDLNFNWRFAPGSDIFINWKNNIAGGENLMIHGQNYFNSFKNFENYPQTNSLSVRIVYFIDYLNIKKSLS